MRQRLKHYISLTRLNRPIGILLLLWPTFWALWIATVGRPNTTILVVFVVGTRLLSTTPITSATTTAKYRWGG